MKPVKQWIWVEGCRTGGRKLKLLAIDIDIVGPPWGTRHAQGRVIRVEGHSRVVVFLLAACHHCRLKLLARARGMIDGVRTAPAVTGSRGMARMSLKLGAEAAVARTELRDKF